MNAIRDKPLPPLPQGHFEVIVSTESCQVFIFRYDHASGCSSTGNDQHSNLPGPVAKHKSWESITEEPKVHVGFVTCLAITSLRHIKRYSNDSETYYTKCCFGEPERSRTTEMITDLKSQVGEEFEIKLLGWEYSHYSPFKGGSNQGWSVNSGHHSIF